MLELHHNGMSTCSQKVRLALAEKRLDWKSRHLDLRAGDQQKPAYVALNPRAVVPTLVHDGRPIRESNVILEYLEDAYPDPGLRPADAYGKAQMRLWTKRLDEGHHDIATSTLSMGIAFRHQYLAKGVEAYEALIAKVPDPVRRERRREVIQHGTDAATFRTAVGMWLRLLDDMDAALAANDWLAGPVYTIADAAFTPYLTRLEHLNVLGFLEGRPHVRAWYERLKARASYKTAIEDWNDPNYLPLMAEKGAEAWPRVAAIIAEAAA